MARNLSELQIFWRKKLMKLKKKLSILVSIALVLTLMPSIMMMNASAAATQVSASTAVAAMLGDGVDAFVTNMNFEGQPAQLATFNAPAFATVPNMAKFATPVNPMFFSQGVVISTGSTAGTFTTATHTDVGGTIQNSRLALQFPGIYGGGNSASLSFDILIPPGVNELSFTYFFMSAEFTEDINDVFTLWVYPVDQVPTTGDQLRHYNIARLEDGITEVSVDTLRGQSSGVAPGAIMPNALWIGQNMGGQTVSSNGVSSVLVANASDLTIHSTHVGGGQKLIVPGRTVRVEMVIANRSDRWFDSAVFIKANSVGFSADGSGISTASGKGIDTDTGHGFITVEDTDVNYTYVIVDEATDKVVAKKDGTGDDIVFGGLMPGQKYKILVYEKTNPDIPGVGDVDPQNPDEESDVITLPVVDTNVVADIDEDTGVETATIVINPSSNTVKYAVVYDSTGIIVDGTAWTPGNGGEIRFEGLDPSEKYRIVTVPIGNADPAPGDVIAGGDEVVTPFADFVDVDGDSVDRSGDGFSITVDPTIFGQQYAVVNTLTGVITTWRNPPGTGTPGTEGGPITFTGLDPTAPYKVITRTAGSPPSVPGEGIIVAGKEPTPAATINYANGQLQNLVAGATYTVNGTTYVAATGGVIDIHADWYDTSVSIIKKGISANNTVDSSAQTLAIPDRPSAPTPVGGVNQITGVTTDLEYRLSPSGTWQDVTDVTITGVPAGVYEVRVKATSPTTFPGAIATVTVTSPYIGITNKETTPTAKVDFINKQIIDLVPDAVYIIEGKEYTADKGGKVAIDSTWFGKSIGIAKKGDNINTINSDVQTLVIPSIPGAPTGVTGGDEKITGVNNTLEYRKLPDGTWTSITGTSVTGLPAGTYEVRVKATGSSFAGDVVTVVVTSDNLYADSDTTVVIELGDGYAILEIETGEDAPFIILNTPADDIFEMVFTQDELKRIEDGESARVFIIVEDISDTISDAEKLLVNEAMMNNQSLSEYIVGMYIDITKFKQVGNDSPTQLFELNKPIKISIVIPEELQAQGREYKLIRVHNGEVDIISGTYDHATGLFTFETDRFSTYVIIYSEGNPNTGIAIGLSVLATTAGVAWLSRKQKKYRDSGIKR